MSTRFGSFNPRPSPSFKKSSRLPTVDINICLVSVHVHIHSLKTRLPALSLHPSVDQCSNNLTAECFGDMRFVICLFIFLSSVDKHRMGELDVDHKYFDIHTISHSMVLHLKTHSPFHLNGLTYMWQPLHTTDIVMHIKVSITVLFGV